MRLTSGRALLSGYNPADAASKRINRLLKKAGAIERNIEVVHSLRHGAKDLLIDEDIDDETADCKWVTERATFIPIMVVAKRSGESSATS